MIKSKQLENTLRSDSNPFDAIYADKTFSDLNGAVRFTALNNTGSTINAFSVVYINGVSGNTPTIALADANSTAMPAFGLTASQVNTGNEIDVITFGSVKGVDTSLLPVGTVLYASTVPGQYTDTPPSGSSAKLQNIGMVVKSHENGIIKVGGAGRSAATPNLDEGKFFIGNASDQSVQSAYALPLADGSENQVLSTNGSGQLSFIDQSGGESVTPTTKITSNTVNASLNERYLLYSTTSNITVNLPITPSTGDFVLIFPRYWNGNVTISSSDENIAAAGFFSAASTLEMTFNSNEEVAIVYSGTEWVVESKNSDVYFYSSTSLNLNASYFSRYHTVFVSTTSNLTITLPEVDSLYEKSKLEFIATSEDFRTNTLTINSAAGETTVNLVGTTSSSSAVSTVTTPLYRRFTIQMYNNKFYVVPSFSERAGIINHLAVIPYATAFYSGTAIDLNKNTRYLLSSSTPMEVNLPQLSTLTSYGDFVEMSQSRSSGTPNYVTVNLNPNDAATAIFSGLGFVRSNLTSIDSIRVPLTTGTLRLTKTGGSSWAVQLLQSGFGSPIVLDTNGTASYDLDIGMTYIVDTAAIGANTTLNLPYPYDEMSTTETIVKILDDTYDVTIDPYSNGTIDGSSTITLSAGNSALKTLNITPYTQGKYIVLSNY